MSSAAPDQSSAPPPIDEPGSLVGVIQVAQLVADDAVVQMQELAARAQRHRHHVSKVSDVAPITRSTALWAAMQVDGGLRTVLEECGVSAEALAQELSLTTVQFPDPPTTYQLHADFASAMSSYLADRDVDGPVGLPEVVLALLRSTRRSTSGLLGLRIPSDARTRAIERLEKMLGPRRLPRLDLQEFSESVRTMRRAFPEGEPVTAGRLAAQLQNLHGEYASQAFAQASLDTERGVVLPVDEWLRRVRDVYDMPAALGSKHEGIDGRLFLLGLAAVDGSLADDLTRQGLMEALQSEVDVLPRDASAPDSPAAEALAGGLDTDRVDPTKGISLKEDQLEVAPYVRMLASVICDQSTPVPLSVGIFGEWGSGKSFFMGMLRQRIDDIRVGTSNAYWHDIRQISFNAWHYADTNLWASLGDEIFRQLLGEKDDNAARQLTLRAELEKSNQQRKELEAAAATAEGEVTRLRAELEDASATLDVRAKALLEGMKNSPAVQDRMARVWRNLGIEDTVEQSRVLADHVRGTVSETSAIRRALAGPRGMVAAGVTVVMLLAVLVIALLPGSTLEQLVRGAAATLATFLAAAVAVVSTARSGFKQLGTLIDEVQTGAADAEAKEREEKLAPRLNALRQAEAASEVAESQLVSVVAHIGQLNHELAELAPGQRLYSFLADRVAAGDYSRSLGVISTIRKDFEQLTELMRQWRDRADKTDMARVPIDRIVLYIDDLDRCSSKQVVDVLQAVHLLLALDLFIVVVGVDPRWLLKSLQREYPDLLESRAGGSTDDKGWDASPEDYLEKIFTIPLILPAMNKGSLERMLREVVLQQQRANERLRAVPPTVEPPTTPVVTLPTAEPNVTKISVELGSLASDAPPQEARPLEDFEIKLLGALQPLVRTPREAKRMVNLYRMIRSTRDLSSDGSRFIRGDGEPGDYQAVALLLGLLSAPGNLLGDVLDAPRDPKEHVLGGLTKRDAGGTWSEFVTGMTPKPVAGRWVNDFAVELTPEDRVRWQRLASGLAPATPLVGLGSLSELQTWAEKIRRFSFVMSPSADRRDS